MILEMRNRSGRLTDRTALVCGLALFIYGMNLMSDGLQKAAGEKMKNILSLLTRNVFIGVLAGAATTAGAAKQQCYDSHGHRFRYCRSDESETGDQHYHRCEYRNDYNGTAGCVPDR